MTEINAGFDADVIDTLVGIGPGSALDAIRKRRPQARTQAQASYRALFTPETLGGIAPVERFAQAAYVCGLHGEAETGKFYTDRLAASGGSAELRLAVDAAIAAARGEGPYGAYPAGPLSGEDTPGPVHRTAGDIRDALGQRLASAFDHLHMLAFHPRDAAPEALQDLLNAGWSTTDIVTLSQIASFLAFQIRVVAGLRVLAATTA